MCCFFGEMLFISLNVTYWIGDTLQIQIFTNALSDSVYNYNNFSMVAR